jgi:hypothetical protein
MLCYYIPTSNRSTSTTQIMHNDCNSQFTMSSRMMLTKSFPSPSQHMKINTAASLKLRYTLSNLLLRVIKETRASVRLQNLVSYVGADRNRKKDCRARCTLKISGPYHGTRDAGEPWAPDFGVLPFIALSTRPVEILVPEE